MKKRILAILMSFVLMLGILPVTALAVDVIDSGKCGANLIWKLDENGKLTISGRSAMYDYDYDTVPWLEYIETIKNVVIEEGVTSVGEYAFTSCVNLTFVTMPESVTSIGDYAFYGCEKLPEIIIPDRVRTIGFAAFYECNSLTEVTIPDGVTTIEMWTFGWSENLTTVNIPDSVTRIEELAFYGCKSLREIVIPDGVTVIKDSTFGKCESLVSVTIPDSVRTIETEAFASCKSLSEIAIPDGVTSIGYYAFAWCDSLTSFEIPASVVELVGNVFYLCVGMEEYIVDENNQYYSADEYGVLFNKDKSVLIQAPINGIEGHYAIPDGVVSVEHYAFDSCKDIFEITIPASVLNAGSYVDCDCLSEFIVAEDNPNYSGGEHGALYNKDKSELICVPGNITGVFIVPACVKKLNEFAFTENDHISVIKFVGDAPSFDGNYLLYRRVYGYYPEENVTWTREAMESYGPLITWLPYSSDGDVNRDGRVTNADLIMVARYIVELYSPETVNAIKQYGDMDGDSNITNADLISIARIIVGL